MKTIAFAAGALAVCMTAALADPPSYPMLCRGGPGMRIMVNHDVTGSGIPGATAMFVYFNKAPMPGSMGPPPPGSCTWMDRPLNAAEPAVLWIRSADIAFAFQVMGNGMVVRDATGPRLNVEGATLSPEAGKWEMIVRAVMTGGTFTVHAYNAGGRVMSITSVP
ncbi:MAG TPA: hypothetical protein VMU01_07815 [Rhizomicrobium sp.]|nr:hypothetical protein [Rhizomicrobium sp.]